MNAKQVWGCILCALGTGFFLSAISSWIEYRDMRTVMDQMDQMTSNLIGQSNLFSKATESSIKDMASTYRTHIAIFLALGIGTGVAGTLMLKHPTH